MKTAISVPDDVFDAAKKRAEELGISRSEFFATAARRYLDQLARASLTEQIDDVLTLPDYDPQPAEAASAAGRRRLSADDDW